MGMIDFLKKKKEIEEKQAPKEEPKEAPKAQQEEAQPPQPQQEEEGKKDRPFAQEWEHVHKLTDMMQKTWEAMKKNENYKPEPCDMQQFILMLSGITSMRVVPGIPHQMGYDKLYICETDEDREKLREHLKNTTGITDLASLNEQLGKLFHTGMEYQQFWGSWQGKPLFDESQLTEEGKHVFTTCRNFAEIFRDVVGPRGFTAWDHSERIGLLRLACACGIIDEDKFWQMSMGYAMQAMRGFHNWEDYALSCISGGAYYIFRQSNANVLQAMGFFDLNCRIVHRLYFTEGIWSKFQWQS